MSKLTRDEAEKIFNEFVKEFESIGNEKLGGMQEYTDDYIVNALLDTYDALQDRLLSVVADILDDEK